MTSPSDQLRATVAKVAAIAQAIRDAADAAQQAVTERIQAEASEQEGVPGGRPSPADQTQA